MRVSKTSSNHWRAIPTALIMVSACGHGARTASVPVPATGSTPGRIPAQIGRYRLTRRDGVNGFPNDSAYRFSDGSATRVTALIYSIPPDVQVGPDSQSWTMREGEKFQEVQPLLVRRGAIEAFSVAFANSGEIKVENHSIPEHATAIAVRSRGNVTVDFQYLYLVDGRFLKVRATVPSEGWERTDVPVFARDLARRLATADTARERH